MELSEDVLVEKIKKLFTDDFKEIKVKLEKLDKLENDINDMKNDMDDMKNDIKNHSYQINMITSGHFNNGPQSFLEALSPAAATGAPIYYTNPAYRQ